MAIQRVDDEYELSLVRMELVEVSRLYADGFVYLKGDPELWIQSNHGDRLSSVQSLELEFWDHKDDRIGNSIGELSHLTQLCIRGKVSLKCLRNTISRIQNLDHLEILQFWGHQELPANLGDLHNLTSLTLNNCPLLKSLPNSVAKLSRLTTLSISSCDGLLELGGLRSLVNSVANLSNLTALTLNGICPPKELPANLGDLEFLTTLFLDDCDSLGSLPWCITKLSKLRFLYLPINFRLETLPPRLNDSIVISVVQKHVRKTWKKLKTEIYFPNIPGEQAAQETSAPGYFQFDRDSTPWIGCNHNLLSSVRVLDLDLEYGAFKGNIPDSIGELPQLTHLYITNGCLHHHHLPFTRITHLSLIECTFECDIESHIDSLGKLSNLVFLHLSGCFGGRFPNHMDLPISLIHLTLERFSSLPDSYMVSIAKLTNLETLNLCCCFGVESLPLDLNLKKLILSRSVINSVPIGLKHLEILHGTHVFWNQLINLETLSYTCDDIKSFSSVTSLHNLRELQLKDCFSLKELPPNLDELVKLRSLNLSGTRIKSLPNSIMKLGNLQRLILPKCFNLKSLPCDFGYKVKISVDDTDESYYKHKIYHSSPLNKNDYLTSDSIKKINETFLKEFRQVSIIEQASPCIPLNHLPDDTLIPEGSHFSGTKDPTNNNNHHAFSSSLNHEVEFSPTVNEGLIVPSVNECVSDIPTNIWQFHTPIEIEDYHLNGGNNTVSENNSHAAFSLQNQQIQIGTSHGVETSVNAIFAETSSNVQQTISCGENSQEAFRNGRTDNVNLELEQGIALCDLPNSVHGGSDYQALENRQDKISQSGYLKHDAQKKENSLQRIRALMSQNIRLEDAAEKHLGVSRSTLKRALKKNGLKWPSTRKRKNPDKNWNETHDTVLSSSGRNLSQLDSVDPSNPAGLGRRVRHFDGPSQLTMSDHVTSEFNVVNESNSDTVTRTVEEPPMSTQCHMDGNQHVEEHVTGAKECASANTDVHPNESGSTFTVKATYNKDTVRFDFSLSSSIEQLKEEIGKRFELEVGKFKLYYEDDEKEWILLACISDLEHALHFFGSNVVRLSIKLRKR